MTPSKSRKPSRTRKHNHFRVTVTYSDNEQSAKVFTNREKAEKLAARQEKSPVIKSAQVVKLT
jgi:hypothetical protein